MLVPTINSSALRFRSPLAVLVFLQWYHIYTVCSHSRTIKLILYHRHIWALHTFWILCSNFLHIQRNRSIFQWSTIRYHPIILSLALPSLLTYRSFVLTINICKTFHCHSKSLRYAHHHIHSYYYTHLNRPNCFLWILRSCWTWGTIFLRSLRPHWIYRCLCYR